nr:ISL3 family transposase [Streptomyces sp. Ag109_G2-15]
MCEWSASAPPPTSLWWRRCLPLARAVARTAGYRRGVTIISYQRSLHERPLGSRRVIVRLRVRRYFCDRKSCSRKTFVEQVPGLCERHRRSSTGLTGWLWSIAIELGGRPAARLCRRLQLVAGRTRLLRLLTAAPVPDRAPRVLGVDEFAFRTGCAYGTVLVDVEAGRVVDVLPNRTSETFAAWLTKHPGAEIICRDRATAYTKAVKEAAPHALEVADRWHLLQNLSAAVAKTCHQHRDCLRNRAEEETVTEVLEPPPMLLPPAELPRPQIIERTRHRYEDIHRLLEKRWTISAIARRLNLDRKTVRRFRDTDLDELLVSARERRPNGVLEPFKAYLNARFTEAQGQVSGTRLFLEIQARGYRGSRQVVRKHLAALRAHRRTSPGRHSEPSQDHLMDHAAPGDAHREPGRAPPSSPARLPGHHPGLRSRSGVCRPGPSPARLPVAGVDPAGRASRAEAHEGLRGHSSPGPRRGDRRSDLAMELRGRRGTRKPGENTQASYVRPSLVRTPPGPDPHPAVSSTELRAEPISGL